MSQANREYCQGFSDQQVLPFWRQIGVEKGALSSQKNRTDVWTVLSRFMTLVFFFHKLTFEFACQGSEHG